MFRTLIVPAFGIVSVSTVLGLSVNALRDADRIEIGRAYYAPDTQAAPGPRLPLPWPTNGDAPSMPSAMDSELARRAAAEFTVIDADRARRLFETSRYDASRVAFVDARSDAHFLAGRIPGSVRVDYYNLRRDVEPVLPALGQVRWLVVYCESVECDDGLLLCRALRDEYRIRAERLILYVGGMHEWRALRLPVEVGA